MNPSRIPSKPVVARPCTCPFPAGGAGLSPAETKAAGALKRDILDLLMRVRMAPTPVAQQPKFDEQAARYRSPEGNLLFKVMLSEPHPAGAADMISHYALVDPKTNRFWSVNSGGFAGLHQVMGPLSVPNAPFKRGSYPTPLLRALETAANPKPQAFHAAPKVLSASYFAGMGARPPEGMYAGPKVNVEVQFPNITYQPTWSVKLDEKTRTLTVTVDAKSGNPNSKAMSMPQTLEIPIDRPAQDGKKYTLRVVDWQGRPLHTGHFTPFLPA